jgi:hypothetical protein
MPQTRCTDWDRVKLRCRVIGNVLQGLVTIFVEPQEIAYDEDLAHWDPIETVVVGTLVGREVNLRRQFVPPSLRFPNKVFWLTVHNDESLAIYDDPDSLNPLTRGTQSEAGI